MWIMLTTMLSAFTLLGAATIRGEVTTADSQPLNQCNLSLYFSTPEHNHSNLVRSANTDAQGSFTINNVPIGSYYLYACTPGYLPGFYATEGTGEIRVVAVDADDQEVVGVDIQLFVHNDPPPPPPNSGDIAGFVINGAIPIPHALIGVSTLANPLIPLQGIYGRTNWDGHYFVNHIPAGTYTACVINESNMQSVALSAPITVVDHGFINNVNISYSSGSSYSLGGTVRNPNNQPVHNGVVEIRSVADGTPEYMHLHRTEYLHPNGSYQFTDIPEGEYIVSVWTHENPIAYYPSTFSADQATPVLLNGTSLNNINIIIPTNTMYSISGQVLDADSHLPVAGISVKTDRMGFHHFPIQDSLFTDEYAALTNENGEYSISAPLGRYTVVAMDSTDHFYSQYYDHTANPYAANIIWLDHNVSDVNFELQEIPVANTGSITGMVYDNGEIPTYPVMVVAVSSDEDWEDSALVGMDGSYQINSLPPETYFLIAFSLYNPPSYYNSVLTWEEAEQVTVGGTVAGIDFNLVYSELDGPSNVVGRIQDGNNAGLANVTVALKNSSDQVVGFARTDENGDYTIYNVPSQDYTVVATKLGLHSLAESINLNGTLSYDIVMASTANVDDNLPTASQPGISIYPNPCNPVSNIAIALPKATVLKVKIYNMKGQCIKTLTDRIAEKGTLNLSWDGSDQAGNSVSNGIYLIKINTEDSQSSKKLTLLK